MLISHFVEGCRSDLEGLGRLGGEEFEDFAARLGDAVAPALRARLLEALDSIVAEANAQVDDSGLGLALAGDEVSIVHTGVDAHAQELPGELTARFALRLPEELKARVDQLAQRTGASTNSWIVRVLTQEAAQSSLRSARQAGRQLRGTGRS
jgi:predicted transcriptional regulator